MGPKKEDYDDATIFQIPTRNEPERIIVLVFRSGDAEVDAYELSPGSELITQHEMSVRAIKVFRDGSPAHIPRNMESGTRSELLVKGWVKQKVTRPLFDTAVAMLHFFAGRD